MRCFGTPLFVALRFRRKVVVEFLVEKGATISALNLQQSFNIANNSMISLDILRLSSRAAIEDAITESQMVKYLLKLAHRILAFEEALREIFEMDLTNECCEFYANKADITYILNTHFSGH